MFVAVSQDVEEMNLLFENVNQRLLVLDPPWDKLFYENKENIPEISIGDNPDFRKPSIYFNFKHSNWDVVFYIKNTPVFLFGQKNRILKNVPSGERKLAPGIISSKNKDYFYKSFLGPPFKCIFSNGAVTFVNEYAMLHFGNIVIPTGTKSVYPGIGYLLTWKDPTTDYLSNHTIVERTMEFRLFNVETETFDDCQLFAGGTNNSINVLPPLRVFTRLDTGNIPYATPHQMEIGVTKHLKSHISVPNEYSANNIDYIGVGIVTPSGEAEFHNTMGNVYNEPMYGVILPIRGEAKI